MTKIAAILGSVTPPGRLSSAVAGALARADASGHSTTLLDLGQLAVGFADGRPLDQLSDDTPTLVSAISEADAVILATPVYRATLTGALKNAIDLLPIEALRGKPVGIVVMGATLHHYLGAESHLRDILAWFGAVSLPTAIYLSSADFADGKLTETAAATLDELVEALAGFAAAVKSLPMGPAPLAGGRPK
jgi:FMN reductase